VCGCSLRCCGSLVRIFEKLFRVFETSVRELGKPFPTVRKPDLQARKPISPAAIQISRCAEARFASAENLLAESGSAGIIQFLKLLEISRYGHFSDFGTESAILDSKSVDQFRSSNAPQTFTFNSPKQAQSSVATDLDIADLKSVEPLR